MAYRYLGRYQEALECHKRAAEIHHDLGNLLGEAAELGNLGLAHFYGGDATSAVVAYERSLKIAEVTGICPRASLVSDRQTNWEI